MTPENLRTTNFEHDRHKMGFMKGFITRHFESRIARMNE